MTAAARRLPAGRLAAAFAVLLSLGSGPAPAPVEPSPAELYNLALAQRQSGHPDEAAAQLRRLSEVLPYESAFALGVLAAERGDCEAARGEFARALRAREADAAALADLRWCNARLAASAAGGEAARPLVSLTPAEARRLIAFAAGEGGRRGRRDGGGRW